MEAVNNAMIHGNRLTDQKEILVSLSRTRTSAPNYISDEGSGFDPYKVPDPTSAERIETEGGRGVFLMKQLIHEIH